MPEAHPLRVWRKANHITLSALADQVGVNPSHLSEIENGNNTPSLKLAEKLSLATVGTDGVRGVPLGEFVPQSEAAE